MDYLHFSVKTVGLADSGVVEGLAAVYGNVDRHGDVILPGAFTKTLQENGGQVPLLYQHRQDQPIGTAMLADTSAGLAVSGQLVLEVEEAAKAWALMKARVLRSFSIGFNALRSKPRRGGREFLEIELMEVSLVTIPANPLATVTGLKADDQDAAGFTQISGQLGDLAAEVGLGSVARQLRTLAHAKTVR